MFGAESATFDDPADDSQQPDSEEARGGDEDDHQQHPRQPVDPRWRYGAVSFASAHGGSAREAGEDGRLPRPWAGV